MPRPATLLTALAALLAAPSAGAGNLGPATAGGDQGVLTTEFSVEYDVRSVEARVADLGSGEPTGQPESLAWLRAGGPHLVMRLAPVRYFSLGGKVGGSRPLVREGDYDGVFLLSYGADVRVTPVHAAQGRFRFGALGQFERTRDEPAEAGSPARFTSTRFSAGLGWSFGDDRDGYTFHVAALYSFVDAELYSPDGGTRYQVRTQIPVGVVLGAELVSPALNAVSLRNPSRIRAALEVRAVDTWGVGGRVGASF